MADIFRYSGRVGLYLCVNYCRPYSIVPEVGTVDQICKLNFATLKTVTNFNMTQITACITVTNRSGDDWAIFEVSNIPSTHDDSSYAQTFNSVVI